MRDISPEDKGPETARVQQVRSQLKVEVSQHLPGDNRGQRARGQQNIENKRKL